jgi:gliding motility-associated-like protein
LDTFKFYFFLLFSLQAAFTSRSQQCTGSLGDPIINIDFGSGSNFGSPLPAGTTSSLQYQAATCPRDGFYSIVSYTSGCWANDVVWHTARDHTTNNNGYFMLVNASYQPSNFFIQTITGLCDGTTYEFAAWLLNMCSVSGILPDITMTIEKMDGNVLATYNTGSIPIKNPVTWEKYGFYFTTPAGITNVVLRMRNNAPGGVGNDVGVDDITFRAAGPSISVAITGVIGDSLVACTKTEGDVKLTSSVDNCYTSTSYQWQTSTNNGSSWNNVPGATQGTFVRPALGAGQFLYRVTVSQTGNTDKVSCRVVSQPVTIIVLPEPQPKLDQVYNICKDDSIVLTPGNFETYKWQDGSTQTKLVVKRPGKYAVSVTNACGSATAETIIKQVSCGIFFPGAFTPNGDHVNDRFRLVTSYDLDFFQLVIFNRWGQKVFESRDYKIGWDGLINGSESTSSTYVWFCTYSRPGDKQKTHIKGTVLLVK